MSIARDPSTRDLNDCGCCEERGARTPARIHNRPGLSAIAYRVGTHGAFKQSMLAGLSNSKRPILGNLNTREDDDFSIALVDAWATVADVLTFYQERTANELFLGTASERRSIADLTKLIGYRLRPGVAASTELAFRLETAPGSPREVAIESGTRVQSLPGPGEQPQTFETIEPIVAKPEWNELRPRFRVRVVPGEGSTGVYLKGITTGLQPGDGLLLLGTDRDTDPESEQWDFRRVETMSPDPDAGHTLVTWSTPVGHAVVPPAPRPKVFAMRQRASLFGHNAPDWRAMPDNVKRGFLGLGRTAPIPSTATIWPGFNIFYSTESELPDDDTIYLDAAYPNIVDGSWVVLSSPDYVELYQVDEVVESARSEFTISGKSTRLQLTGENLRDEFGTALRETVVFIQSELLDIAEQPLFPNIAGTPVDPFGYAESTLTPVEGDTIELDRTVPALEQERTLIVAGRRLRARVTQTEPELKLVADDGREKIISPTDTLFVRARATAGSVASTSMKTLRLVDTLGFEGTVSFSGSAISLEPSEDSDPVVAEVVTLNVPPSDDEPTILTFADDLSNIYDRPTVIVYGNVASATHGESVTEVLGSGDTSKPYQRFKLRQSPLTYVPSDDPSGGDSTLEVRVNGVKWSETASLYGHGPRDRVYVTDVSDDGETTVQFGDGFSGVRPPTGQEDITASYRKGVGDEGEVDAGQLSLLMTRPLGLQGVTNPRPATGGQDPQQLDDARENAPLTVLTLDRIVSLHDYSDFARSFSGIAKALATWTWGRTRRHVLITVAGDGGAAVEEDSLLHSNLVSAIRKAGNPRVPFRVETYRHATFTVAGTVMVHPDYPAESVLNEVRSQLQSHFSFEARSFGQLVAMSEIVEAIHDVSGVIAADIDRLHRSDEPPSENPVLMAHLPPSGSNAETVQPAEILTIDPISTEQIEVRQ